MDSTTSKRKGQIGIDNIGDIALSIGIAVIVVAVIAMVLAQMAPATYAVTQANRTFDNSSTLTTVGYGLLSCTLYNETCNLSATMVEISAANYVCNTTLVNITDMGQRVGGNECAVWTYNAGTNATTILGSGLAAIGLFADWFSIIIIVAISVIILALVMLLRGRRTSRGRT